MPQYFIRALNSHFSSRDGGSDYDQPSTALTSGVGAAVAIAADEIQKGQSNAAVEVTIETLEGTPVLRSVVTLTISPLMPVPSPAGDDDEPAIADQD